MADTTFLPALRVVPIMAGSKASSSSGRSSRRSSAEGIETSERRLKERLSGLNCYAAEILGDGNCLFASLADQIYGTPGGHDEIRHRLVDHMREHRDAFIHFVDLGPERPRSTREASKLANRSMNGAGSVSSMDRIHSKFEEMLSNMGESHVWGGAFELQAFCQVYHRDIVVYRADNSQRFTSNLHPASPSRETVHLAYHEYRHYSSVRSLCGPHTGLPKLPRQLGAEEADAQAATEHNGDAEVGRHPVETQTPPTASSLHEQWKISTVSRALPNFDDDKIRAMLTKCNGDVAATFHRLLDSDELFPSSPPVTTTLASTPENESLSASERPRPSLPLGTHLQASSRSSSRHSTGSKRRADPSDDEDEVRRPVRRRRRLAPKEMTFSFAVKDEKGDALNFELAVDSDSIEDPPMTDTEEDQEDSNAAGGNTPSASTGTLDVRADDSDTLAAPSVDGESAPGSEYHDDDTDDDNDSAF